MGLHAAAAQQPSEQVGVDAAQAVHADLPAKLVEHPGRRAGAAQPGKAPPRWLLRKLGEQKVERVGAGEQRQQMDPPELRGVQVVAPTAGGGTGNHLHDEVVGHKIAEAFEQGVGARRRKNRIHA